MKRENILCSRRLCPAQSPGAGKTKRKVFFKGLVWFLPVVFLALTGCGTGMSGGTGSSEPASAKSDPAKPENVKQENAKPENTKQENIMDDLDKDGQTKSEEMDAEKEEIIDGGTIDNSKKDAPKEISSDEITNFYCRFSTIPLDDIGVLGGKIFQFKAEIKGDKVEGSYEMLNFDNWNTIPFTTDLSFMQKLQDVVKQGNMARYNGISEEVQGLPEDFGADLKIDYATGERVYAHNNEDCFFEVEEMMALEELFAGAVGE